MLPATYRLHRHSDISETIRRGARARRGGLVVHLQATPSHAPAQAAFAVGKSVGNSVVRHQVVRRLRALMPPVLDGLPPGSRVVVRALPEAAAESSEDLRRDLVSAITRLKRDDPEATGPQMPVLSPTEEAVDAPKGAPDRTGVARVGWYVGAPLRWLLIALVWTYRHTISPILPPTCRFHPSCSAYALEALQVHGAAKGFVLAVWRVLRCNPFNAGGLDPVPAHGAWLPEILPDGRPRTPAHAAGGTA